MKILVFAILCLCLWIKVGGQLTHYVKESGGGFSPVCVAEGSERYEAIEWNFEAKSNPPQTGSHFLPKIDNPYNCKFSSNLRCSQYWSMRNWFYDDNSTRRFDLLTDERWEDLPVDITSETTKEFEELIELPKIFELGFSLRISEGHKTAEVFLCEGPSPKKYPCYLFRIESRKIVLSKHQTYDILGKPDRNFVLESYQTFSDILKEDEWKSFTVGIDGAKITLWDADLNRTLIEKSDDNNVAYFTYRSNGLTLWKIHQNQYFYTKTPQISRLGPSLNLNSKDLCVSLFVSMCPSCQISFLYIENGKKIFLQQEELRKFRSWSLIRLYEENIAKDIVNIFIQTSFVSVNKTKGFWAIDNVRVCDKNEIKISEITGDVSEEVACQLVAKPNFKPKKISRREIDELPQINSASDARSINLTWTNDHAEGLEYFISYEGNDICQENDNLFSKDRIQARGFTVTKTNFVSLNDLIPYTKYNVTIETVFHKRKKHITATTKANPSVSYEELPSKVRYYVTDTTAQITWDRVTCDRIFGPIEYFLKLIDRSNITSFDKQTENTKKISGLKPSTNYSVEIATSRNFYDGKDSHVISVHFQTKPGLAGKAENLEIYSTSKDTLSLRFDLPKNNPGEVFEVHVSRCNPLFLKKCKSTIVPLTRCPAFPKKYCVDIGNLIPNQKQLVKLSLKNKGSHTFGLEEIIEGVNEEKVPGVPTNVTYEVYDCGNSEEFCHLKIDWLHPYEQNGSITAFNILLKGTTRDNQTDVIKEVYRIKQGKYLPRYSYKMKYMPYGKSYRLKLQSVNDEFKSKSIETIIDSPETEELDQSPKLKSTMSSGFVFEIQPKDPRLDTTIRVIVQSSDRNESLDREYLRKNDIKRGDLCYPFGTVWISQVVTARKDAFNISVDESKKLESNKTYCIIFSMLNNNETKSIYSITLTTLPNKEEEKGTNFIYIAVIVMMVLLIFAVIYWCGRNRRDRVKYNRGPIKMKDMENDYEALPYNDDSYNMQRK